MSSSACWDAPSSGIGGTKHPDSLAATGAAPDKQSLVSACTKHLIYISTFYNPFPPPTPHCFPEAAAEFPWFPEHFPADETFCHLRESWDLKCMLSVITYFMQFCDCKDEVDCNGGLLSPPAQPRMTLVLNYFPTQWCLWVLLSTQKKTTQFWSHP